jgi:hypothetical protein
VQGDERYAEITSFSLQETLYFTMKSFSFTVVLVKVKKVKSLSFNSATRHEGVLGSGVIAPLIL